MSEFKASSFSNEFGGGSDLVGITTLTSPYYFVPPSGSTAERPSDPPPGMLRFNTDIGRLEVWRNDHWATILGESPNLGDQKASTGESRAGTGTRALFAGGANIPTMDGKIEYITIETLGNSVAFGDMSADARTYMGQASSRTRALFAGGYSPGPVATVSTCIFSSTGNTSSYSSLSSSRFAPVGLSNQTRALFAGGSPTSGSNAGQNVIDYFTISAGGIVQDFGDLVTKMWGGMSCASSVRGVIGGGTNAPTGAAVNRIDFVTISTQGNSQDFGDFSGLWYTGAFSSNATRGVFGGGNYAGSTTDNIEFLTIASTGNSMNFGDLSVARTQCTGASNSTRAVFAGGYSTGPSTFHETIEYVTISTTGDAVDFGDAVVTTHPQSWSGVSNGHGGL